MEYEQWLGILTSINADNNLNESNVIEKIKEKLEKENPDTYKEWENNEFDINHLFTVDRGRSTLLHCAVNNSRLDIAKYLIENEADVNLQNLPNENTPLHLAVVCYSLNIVTYLTGNGADVNLQNQYGETPLHRATANSRTDTVIYLIENGANTGLHDQRGKLLCVLLLSVA